MKKTVATFILFSLCASAWAVVDPNGDRVTDYPNPLGNLFNPPPEAYAAAGYREETPEDLERWEAEQAAADAALAEADAQAELDRIANKSPELKAAENAFLGAIMAFNAQFPAQAITLDDGFIQITAKIEASELTEIKQLKLGMSLRTLWDVVLFHGGQFGDVQYHQEVGQ